MLRTAIRVKFLSCTSHRPDRLIATTMSAHPVSVSVSFWAWDCDDDRYNGAVVALLAKLGDGWGRVSEWVAGGTAEGRVYVRISKGA